MVFASSASIFACTSSDQFSHASTVSTLDITKGEQRALCKFSASWILSLLRRCFAPSNVADTFKTDLRPASFKRQPNEEAFFQNATYNHGILTKIRACEHLQKFCELEQATTHLIFASNSSKDQILRALSNWMGPFDTPSHCRKICNIIKN